MSCTVARVSLNRSRYSAGEITSSHRSTSTGWGSRPLTAGLFADKFRRVENSPAYGRSRLAMAGTGEALGDGDQSRRSPLSASDTAWSRLGIDDVEDATYSDPDGIAWLLPSIGSLSSPCRCLGLETAGDGVPADREDCYSVNTDRQMDDSRPGCMLKVHLLLLLLTKCLPKYSPASPRLPLLPQLPALPLPHNPY